MPRRLPKTPKREPKQERAKSTVDALLEATAHVLVHDGYDRASTNRIAEVAGVNIGSLYQYFPGKDALVAALIDRHLAAITRVLADHLASSVDAPLRVAVSALVRAHLLLHAADTKLHKVLIQQVPRVERLNPIVRLRREVTDFVRAWLEQRRSELRVDDLDFAAFAIVNIVDTLTQAAVLERPEYLAGDQLAGQISEIVLRYVAKKSER